MTTPKDLSEIIVIACCVFAGVMVALNRLGLISFGAKKVELPDCDDTDCKAAIATLQANYATLKEKHDQLNKDVWENFIEIRNGAALISTDIGYIRGRIEGKLK